MKELLREEDIKEEALGKNLAIVECVIEDSEKGLMTL